jgi:O-antigen ligase
VRLLGYKCRRWLDGSLVAQRTKTFFSKFNWARSLTFWLLAAYLGFVFLTGGGSRHDVQSLVILRPIGVIMCGVALLTLQWNQVRSHLTVFGLAAATFMLVIIHLIPLPPGVWQMLPGREIFAEVDRIAGTNGTWRPIALVPYLAWNALYALLVPLAVLLLGVQLTAEERYRLLPVVLGLAMLSGLVGLIQVLGPSEGPLYLYKHTTNGAAVGLFANRNHQAALLSCLFPVLAIFASYGVRSEERAIAKKWLALGCGAFLIPLILVTGSRAGIATGALGLASAFFLYRKPQSVVAAKRGVKRFDPQKAIVGLAVLSMVALTIIMSRAEAFRRLLDADQTEDLRWQMWGPISDMAMKYFPWGSGIGSFVQVYQIDEPDRLLGLSYVNRAHNDWLEIWLTAGVPGVVLLALILIAFLRGSYAAFRADPAKSRSIAYARLGSMIIVIFGLASLFDYPFRTPSIACVGVVAILWLCGKGANDSEKARRF